MSHIYGLKLEDNKYYVGRSNDIETRIKNHKDGVGSSWTCKYNFIEVLFVEESYSPFDEDKYTKELMTLYGIDNVRGGTYSTIVLDINQKQFLQKEIWSAKNYCNRCGNNNHFVKDCTQKIDINGDNIESKPIAKKKTKSISKTNKIDINGNNIESKSIAKKKSTNETCKKCNRIGHISKNCYAATKLNGDEIKVKSCTRCKRKGHITKNCYAKTDIDNNIIL